MTGVAGAGLRVRVRPGKVLCGRMAAGCAAARMLVCRHVGGVWQRHDQGGSPANAGNRDGGGQQDMAMCAVASVADGGGQALADSTGLAADAACLGCPDLHPLLLPPSYVTLRIVYATERNGTS
jgi:hypothetical protein